MRDTESSDPDGVKGRFSYTIGMRDDMSPYIGDLEAIATALKRTPGTTRYRQVTVMTSSRSALEVIAQPRQQSGQRAVQEIYRHVARLEEVGNTVNMLWVPSGEQDFPLGRQAKMEAQRAARDVNVPGRATYQARSTQVRLAIARQRQRLPRALPDQVGKYAQKIDKALPGPHIRSLYDTLRRRESNVLAQLRTGMARINSYLHRIGVVESDMCACGRAVETMEHFLFRCTKWDTQREDMRRIGQTKMGNLSYFLGGMAATDGPEWAPDLQEVQATVRFALATKRLEAN